MRVPLFTGFVTSSRRHKKLNSQMPGAKFTEEKRPSAHSWTVKAEDIVTKGEKPNHGHDGINKILANVFPVRERISDRPVTIDADRHNVDHTGHRGHVIYRHLNNEPSHVTPEYRHRHRRHSPRSCRINVRKAMNCSYCTRIIDDDEEDEDRDEDGRETGGNDNEPEWNIEWNAEDTNDEVRDGHVQDEIICERKKCLSVRVKVRRKILPLIVRSFLSQTKAKRTMRLPHAVTNATRPRKTPVSSETTIDGDREGVAVVAVVVIVNAVDNVIDIVIVVERLKSTDVLATSVSSPSFPSLEERNSSE